jgi:hypothetical protein
MRDALSGVLSGVPAIAAEGTDMTSDKEGALRAKIGQILGNGLKTQTEPFPETDREFGNLLVALRELEPGDLEGKLVLSGFTDRPYGPDQMRCQECMYYLVHRKWCDLPELAVPVEPDWFCRLWRI